MKKPKIDVEFERSVAEERPGTGEVDSVDQDRQFGGAPADDIAGEKVDPQAEADEWESRYGKDEMRDKPGFGR